MQLAGGALSALPPEDVDEATAEDGFVVIDTSLSREKEDLDRVKVLLLDMDGTLLDSQSKILPSSAEAIRRALAANIRVVLATGKVWLHTFLRMSLCGNCSAQVAFLLLQARPAAVSACEEVDLAGPDGIVSEQSAGVFTQGLNVFGRGGRLVFTAFVEEDVVHETFKLQTEQGLAVVRCTNSLEVVWQM